MFPYMFQLEKASIYTRKNMLNALVNVPSMMFGELPIQGMIVDPAIYNFLRLPTIQNTCTLVKLPTERIHIITTWCYLRDVIDLHWVQKQGDQ